jgi:hypothetical protein
MGDNDYKMDLFIEKIVAKKKGPSEYIQITAVIFLAFIIILASLFFELPTYIMQLMPLIWAAVIYGAYIFVRSKNVEFEYAVTNGDLDIDKIIGRRKRKRIFTGHCTNFEIIARMHSDKYNQNYAAITKKIIAVSSLQQDDVYFLVMQYNNARTAVYFQPDEKMLKAFRVYIANKIYQ